MVEEAIWESKAGTFLRITVRPKSKKKELIERLSEVEIVFNLKSPARNGKANAELLKRLSKLLQLSTKDIRIVAGHKSKTKTILIQGFSIDDVKKILREVNSF
jgi:uncharacterized protein (TIGR00251 family)